MQKTVFYGFCTCKPVFTGARGHLIFGCRWCRGGLGKNPTLTFLTFPGRVRRAVTDFPFPGTGIKSATCADRKNYMPPAKSFPAGKIVPKRRSGYEKRAVSFRPRISLPQIYDIFQPKANCVKTAEACPAVLLDKIAISDRRLRLCRWNTMAKGTFCHPFRQKNSAWLCRFAYIG